MMMDEDGNMNKIEDGIYLGNIISTHDLQALLAHNISYILTLDSQPLKNVQGVKDIHYKFVQVLDMPAADLLSHFEGCIKFIDEALSVKGRGVLVHCIAGVSRSATIVIAYLMHRDKISFDEALDKVKEQRYQIRPNIGFTEQLELFEQMGNVINLEHDLFRKYKLDVLAHRVKTGLVEEISETQLRDLNTSSDCNDDYYKCRKCRRVLFRNSSILHHTMGMGEAAFDWRYKIQKESGADNETEEMCDKSLFIEPVKWMAEYISDMEGKIFCPKCNSKLGSFTWYGEKCPCGTWIGPAFHIQMAKVDHVRTNMAAPMTSPAVDHVTMNGNSDQSDARNGSVQDKLKGLTLVDEL